MTEGFWKDRVNAISVLRLYIGLILYMASSRNVQYPGFKSGDVYEADSSCLEHLFARVLTDKGLGLRDANVDGAY